MMRILWFAGDPGGYDSIRPVLDACAARGDELFGIAAEPALGIARREGRRVAASAPRHEAIAQARGFGPAVCLAGTSGGPSPDKEIMPEVGVPSICVVDFWTNYLSRFSAALPSAICAIDDRMREEMVALGFPAAVIRVTGNPGFDDLARGIRVKGEPGRTLFISQPVSRDATLYGFDEFMVVSDLIAALPRSHSLAIRLHPRDDRHAYDHYLGSRVALSEEDDLDEDLSRAALVVGMFSPVLIRAAAAGKLAISYEPGLAIEDPLPTNAMGLTVACRSVEELRAALARGPLKHYAGPIFPPGACARVCAVLDELAGTLPAPAHAL